MPETIAGCHAEIIALRSATQCQHNMIVALEDAQGSSSTENAWSTELDNFVRQRKVLSLNQVLHRALQPNALYTEARELRTALPRLCDMINLQIRNSNDRKVRPRDAPRSPPENRMGEEAAADSARCACSRLPGAELSTLFRAPPSANYGDGVAPSEAHYEDRVVL